MRRILGSRSPVRMSDPELVLVFQSLLQEAGIPVVVQDEVRGTVFYPTLWVVNDADYERALEIIDANPPVPRECPECGYDLRGLPEPRCPECGEPFFRPIRPPDWICPHCDERLEGQFTACWKCGAKRPEKPETLPPLPPADEEA